MPKVERKQVSEEEKQKYLRYNYYIITTFYTANLILIYKSMSLLRSKENVLYSVAAAVVALISADFMSYLGHFMFDNYGSEDTPMIGKKMILPFRVHHDDPMEICSHGFVEANGNTSLGFFPPVLMALYYIFAVPPKAGDNFAVFVFSYVVFCNTLMALTNQFHIWSHAYEVPFPVKVMQKLNLFLTRELLQNHKLHHSTYARTYYSLICGWVNYPLHLLKFNVFLESIIRNAFGIEPVTKIEKESTKEQLKRRKWTHKEIVTFPVILMFSTYLLCLAPSVWGVWSYAHRTAVPV